MGGTKAGPRGTAMPSSGKPLKTTENHALPPYAVGFAAVENNVQFAKISVHHVQGFPCQKLFESKLRSGACWFNKVCYAYCVT